MSVMNNVDDLLALLKMYRERLSGDNILCSGEAYRFQLNSLHRLLNDIQGGVVLWEGFIQSPEYESYNNFFSSVVADQIRSYEISSAMLLYENNTSETIFMEHSKDEFLDVLFENKKSEFLSLNINGVRKMVVVGSGPLPHSLIYLYKNTSIKELIGLDNDAHAVDISRNLINRLGMTDRIKIHLADGCLYNFHSIEAIFIPGFVSEKNAICNQIASTACDDTQILVDSSTGMKRLMFTELEIESLPKHLKVEGRHPQRTLFDQWDIVNLRLNKRNSHE